MSEYMKSAQCVAQRAHRSEAVPNHQDCQQPCWARDLINVVERVPNENSQQSGGGNHSSESRPQLAAANGDEAHASTRGEQDRGDAQRPHEGDEQWHGCTAVVGGEKAREETVVAEQHARKKKHRSEIETKKENNYMNCCTRKL